MNKISKAASLSLLVSLLSACGGGSGNSGNEPITPYDVYGSEQNLGRTISIAAGTDGAIEAIKNSETEIEFELVDGLATMNIVNVERLETYSFSCTDGQSGNITFSENFAAGTEQISASFNGQSLNCSTTYPTGLVPSVVGSSSSISDLIVVTDVSDTGDYISSNCPDESTVNDPITKINDYETETTECETSIVMDATITDDTGNTHLISYETVSVPD